MKKVILAAFFLGFTNNAISQNLSVTNTFVDGQTATAAQVNTNFNDVVTAVNAIVRKDDTLFNTAIGALAINPNITTTGNTNTANGYDALYNVTAGSSNTAIGYQALRANTGGNSNTASGYQALYSNTTGDRNTASGYEALYSNTEGEYNTASGFSSLFSNTAGDFNTASGYHALYNNTTGDFNTASGFDALYSNNEGNSNAASGYQALYSNTTGDRNTASGYGALYENTTGTRNTAIGYLADVTTGALTNATAIGYNAKVNASNKVRIGNTSVTVIEGQVGLTITSDARLKEDITVVDAGLALVNDLNPVSYHRINSSSDDIEMGLLAQEVEEVLAAHGLSNSGMVHQANEDAYRSVRYNDLLAPMIRAIQELDEKNNELTEQLKCQQEELLAVVQSQQEQIAQLQRVVEHQFALR